MEPAETVIGQGQVLFKQGDKSTDLFFIKEGQVELSVVNSDGESAVLTTLGDKTVVGSLSFLEGEPRSATAKAITEVKAVIIRQGQREKMLKTVPAWLNVLIKDLSGSLRRSNAEYAHLQAENEALKKKIKALEGRD